MDGGIYDVAIVFVIVDKAEVERSGLVHLEGYSKHGFGKCVFNIVEESELFFRANWNYISKFIV